MGEITFITAVVGRDRVAEVLRVQLARPGLIGSRSHRSLVTHVQGDADCPWQRRRSLAGPRGGSAVIATAAPASARARAMASPSPCPTARSAKAISDEIIDCGDGGEAAEDVVAHHRYGHA